MKIDETVVLEAGFNESWSYKLLGIGGRKGNFGHVTKKMGDKILFFVGQYYENDFETSFFKFW